MLTTTIERWRVLRKHRLILATSFLYLLTTNVSWISYDTRPPFWDMAYQSSSALRIYDAFEEKGLGALPLVPSLTGFYPPLFPSIVSSAWAIFGKSIPVSRMVNLAAVAILLHKRQDLALEGVLRPRERGAQLRRAEAEREDARQTGADHDWPGSDA